MANTKNYENLHINHTVNCITKLPEFFPTHWHKYVEILAMPEDSMGESSLVRVNHTDYRMKAGDILFIWPGELHEISNNSSENLIGLQFPPTLFHELHDFSIMIPHFRKQHMISHKENPSLSEHMLYQVEHIIHLQSKQNYAVGRDYKDSMPSDDTAFLGVEAFIALLELFINFGQHIRADLSSQDGQVESGNSTLEKIHEACVYITDNCDQDITLELVSEQIGFSSSYFSRVFKQHTSYNFVEYLTIQRIKKAQALLSDSALSVTEISYQSGFKSISTFNRVFKQSRGCSPSEYRKYYSG